MVIYDSDDSDDSDDSLDSESLKRLMIEGYTDWENYNVDIDDAINLLKNDELLNYNVNSIKHLTDYVCNDIIKDIMNFKSNPNELFNIMYSISENIEHIKSNIEQNSDPYVKLIRITEAIFNDREAENELTGNKIKKIYNDLIISLIANGKIKFKKVSKSNISNDDICSICNGILNEPDLLNIQDEPEPVKLIKCPHIYHRGCILQWAMTKNNFICPLCRTVSFGKHKLRSRRRSKQLRY